MNCRLVVLLAALVAASPYPLSRDCDSAEAPSLSGRITDASGAPLAGAMVTVLEHGTGIEITEFSGADGTYEIAALPPGSHRVSVKSRGWRTATAELGEAGGGSATADFVLEPAAVPYEDFSGAEMLALLPDGDMKRELLLTCTGCHQFDYGRLTQYGPLKDVAGWMAVFPKMRAFDRYDLIPPDFDEAKYAEWLAEHLTPERLSTAKVRGEPPAPVLTARYTEYPLPALPALPHDLVIGPDRRIWITAFLNDAVWALDPADGTIQSYHVNEDPDVNADVRALEFDSRGHLWIVLGRTESIVDLDPQTGDYRTYGIGMYAHSLALDADDKVWFNGYFSKPERIGVLDGRTGRITLFEIPSAKLTQAQGLPLPYGLQIDQRGTVWNTTLAGNTLVSLDIATGATAMYRMPSANAGPRRPGVGPDGIIWIPEYATGKLARFDPVSKQFTEYDPGLSSLGPYDVEVNQRTGEVWMSGTQNSSILRFDPVSKSFLEYPWPTRPGYVRHIAVDEETGAVWSAYAAFPEDHPKVVRLEPRG